MFDVVFLEEFEEFLVTFHVSYLPPILSRLIGVTERSLTTVHNIYIQWNLR